MLVVFITQTIHYLLTAYTQKVGGYCEFLYRNALAGTLKQGATGKAVLQSGLTGHDAPDTMRSP